MTRNLCGGFSHVKFLTVSNAVECVEIGFPSGYARDHVTGGRPDSCSQTFRRPVGVPSVDPDALVRRTPLAVNFPVETSHDRLLGCRGLHSDHGGSRFWRTGDSLAPGGSLHDLAGAGSPLERDGMHLINYFAIEVLRHLTFRAAPSRRS
jgi:hypothetical protein